MHFNLFDTCVQLKKGKLIPVKSDVLIKHKLLQLFHKPLNKNNTLFYIYS